MTRQFPLVPLGQVAELIRGVTFKPEDLIEPNAEGAVVCFRTANIQQVLQTEDVIAVPANFVRREEQQLRQGDILLSSANSWELVGKCVLVPKLDYPATAGGFISIVRGLPKEVEPRYLFRWMASPATQFLLRRCGRKTTNISNLDVNRFLELPFPNAPLPEQRRIADILDEADALRRKRAEAIRLANDLVPSIFNEMFEDPNHGRHHETDKLEAVCQRITDGEHLNPLFTDRGMPIVMAGDVAEEGVDLSNVKYVSETDGERFRRKAGSEQGDILLVSRGATIGRACIVTNETPFALMGSVILIKPNAERIHPLFLLTVLRNPGFRTKLVRVSGSSAQQAIYIAHIRKLHVPVPPVGQQREFATRVLRVLNQLPLMRRSASELNNLFHSLLQRAFRGEL